MFSTRLPFNLTLDPVLSPAAAVYDVYFSMYLPEQPLTILEGGTTLDSPSCLAEVNTQLNGNNFMFQVSVSLLD